MIAMGVPESTNYLVNVIGLAHNEHGFRTRRKDFIADAIVRYNPKGGGGVPPDHESGLG
jgi:hypothetical protein